MELDELIDNLHYLPIITAILIPATFLITYTIAVFLGHVPSAFALISDTGAFPPESCIFGQLLNIAAILICIVIYIRYLQTKQLSSSTEQPDSLPKWNRYGLIYGLLTSCGLSIIANFQETGVVVAHGFGAFLCFGFGTAYFLVQVWISYEVRPSGFSLKIAHLRCCLAFANAILLILIFVTAIIGFHFYDGDDMTQWTDKHGGWEWHQVTVVSEWICTGCFCLYILTFAHDFQNFRLTHPKVYIG